MADAKLTELAEITTPALEDLIYLVDDPSGTPISKKVTLDNLISMPYGMLYVTGGVGSQTPGTSYVKLTQFDTDGISSSGITPAHADDKITVTDTGIYAVFLQVSFEGSNSEPVMMRVYWNGVAQPQLTMRRKLGVNGDVGSAGLIGLVDVTTGSTDFEVRVKTDAGAKAVDVKEAQFAVFRIAGT